MVAWLLLSGFAEGFGVMALLPVIQVIMGGGIVASGPGKVITEGFNYIGLTPTLAALLVFMVSAISLKGLFIYIASREAGFTVAHVQTDLRLQLFRALLNASWPYYSSKSSGQFSNAITSEAMRAARSYQSSSQIIALSTRALVYIVLALFISWQIAIFAVVMGAVIFLSLGRWVRMSRVAGEKQTHLMKSMISRFIDALQGIKPIKSMACENTFLPLLEQEAEGLNSAQRKQLISAKVLQTVQEPIVVFIVAVWLYGAVSLGGYPFSSLLVMIFLFHRLIGSVHAVQQSYQTMLTQESALWSILDSIKDAVAHAEVKSSVGIPANYTNLLRLQNVNFHYNKDIPVICDLNLSIEFGEFVVFKGSSGTGKTTIIDLITGLLRPTSGHIFVDGKQLNELDMDDWRHRIGYVPQEMFLFHESVLENVTMGDDSITHDEVIEALKAVDAYKFVHDLSDGLNTIVGERGTTLSGGQRQRVAIARALVRKPQLLILDEITTSLDPGTEAEICRMLHTHKGKVTILAITHQKALLEVADRVLEIEKGTVLENN